MTPERAREILGKLIREESRLAFKAARKGRFKAAGIHDDRGRALAMGQEAIGAKKIPAG